MMPHFRGERQDEGKECAQTELNQVNSPAAPFGISKRGAIIAHHPPALAC
jgi:hypothetical protein